MQMGGACQYGLYSIEINHLYADLSFGRFTCLTNNCFFAWTDDKHVCALQGSVFKQEGPVCQGVIKRVVSGMGLPSPPIPEFLELSLLLP